MAEANYETILVKKEDGLATVTFNRPDKRNAMNPQLHRDMYSALTELRYDKHTRVIVLTGAGSSFCAGQDMKQYLAELDSMPESARDEIRRISNVWRNQMIRTLPQPVIASIKGWCVGGAFTTVTSCDVAIAGEDARFCLTEVNFGVLPGGELTNVLTEHLHPKHALFYALTGQAFAAREAERIGLITKAVPAADLEKETLAVAKNLLEKDPVALKAIKEAWYYTFYSTPDVAYEISGLLSQRVTARGRQGIQQFAEKQYRPGLGAYKWEK